MVTIQCWHQKVLKVNGQSYEECICQRTKLLEVSGPAKGHVCHKFAQGTERLTDSD